MPARPQAAMRPRPTASAALSAPDGALAFRPRDLGLLPASLSAALVLLALVALTLIAVAIDVRTRVSVATFGWLYLLVILPVTLRWGRSAGLVTAAASLFLLLTFLTEPRGLPYTKNGADVIRLAISTGGVAIAIFLIDQVNRRLASSDSLLATLVKSSGEAVTGEGLDGTIMSWSPGAERLYGFSAGEVIGQPLSLLMPADRITELDAIMDRLRHGERIAGHQTTRITKSGRLLDVELTISPLRDPNGAITGASAIARDVTAVKRVRAALSANEDALSRAIEQLTDGVVLLDERGWVLRINEPARGFLRASSEQPLRFAALFGGRFTLHPALRWRGIAPAPSSSFLAVDTGGAPLWLRAEVSRLPGAPPGRSALFVMTIRDATQEIEEAYQQLLWRERRSPVPGAGAGSIARLDRREEHQVLTTRESEVLGLIAQGRSNQEIADELGITINTVERHIANVYRKLQIRSRTQATAYALHHGLPPVMTNKD